MLTSFDGYSYIQIDDTTLFPGDDLLGEVHIHVHTFIKATELYVCLTAKEKTQWPKSDSSSRHSGSQVVLQQCLFLHNFQGGLSPGNYNFPFFITIPINAPPTFTYERSTIATRHYSIKARLSNALNFNANKALIWITSIQNDFKDMHSISSNLTIQIKRRLFGKYVSHVNLSLNKNIYFIDEIIRGTLRVDQTRCKRKLIKIHYELIATLTVRDNLGHSNVISGPLISSDKMLRPIHSGPVNVYDFQIDLSSVRGLWRKPSTSSLLIECVYAVRVELVYHGFLSETTHYAALPVIIVNTSQYLSCTSSRATSRAMSRAMSEISSIYNL
jgi:hypothetical protein